MEEAGTLTTEGQSLLDFFNNKYICKFLILLDFFPSL